MRLTEIHGGIAFSGVEEQRENSRYGAGVARGVSPRQCSRCRLANVHTARLDNQEPERN